MWIRVALPREIVPARRELPVVKVRGAESSHSASLLDLAGGIEWDLGPTYTTRQFQLLSGSELAVCPTEFGTRMRSRTRRTSEVVCVTECSDGWQSRLQARC
jgi:hypothetical protein